MDTGDRDEWSLVLSVFPNGNENAHDPRVLITPLDSKKAFIRFRQEWVPKDGKATLLESMALNRCFKKRQWRDFRFFALVLPNGDVFPVRTMHGGFTQSVGNDYLTDEKPIWVAGPDVINSVLQTDRVPRVLRAIRVVPHGKQKGLKAVRLRGAVRIHPGHDDIFRKVIEERRKQKDDKDLYKWLKLFANSIYGCFIELNPETLPRRKAARVCVYSGEKPYVTNKRTVVERPGKWYAPYLASLITAGGRLLLGMLERSVEGWGGTYAWADTDALGVVCNAEGGTLRHVPGCESRRILPRSQRSTTVD